MADIRPLHLQPTGPFKDLGKMFSIYELGRMDAVHNKTYAPERHERIYTPTQIQEYRFGYCQEYEDLGDWIFAPLIFQIKQPHKKGT